MSKFRKKPVVVEAVQWFKHGDHQMVAPYVRTEMRDGYEEVVRDESKGWIKTLEGGHVVSPGDWIIQGVAGEFYPCKPTIFEATYDAVEVRP